MFARLGTLVSNISNMLSTTLHHYRVSRNTRFGEGFKHLNNKQDAEVQLKTSEPDTKPVSPTAAQQLDTKPEPPRPPKPQLPSVASVLSPTQVAYRAFATGAASSALIPLERAQRKLIKAREKGLPLTFAQSFKLISTDNPYKGFFSKTYSNWVKSGFLFGLQWGIGGYAGYGIGGAVQGGLTGAQQALDYRLVKNPAARNYFHVIKSIPGRELYRLLRWPVGVSAASAGVSWAGFTVLSDFCEVKTQELLKKFQLQDTYLASVSPFGVRFLSALAVGSLTYPAYRVVQLKVTDPNISLFVLKTTDTEKLREWTFTIRRPYCSYRSGILIFAVNRAVALSTAYAADKFYALRKETLERPKQVTAENSEQNKQNEDDLNQMRISRR